MSQRTAKPSGTTVVQPSIEFPDGTRVGGPIPGSKYVRSVCRRCGEPIRVVKAGLFDVCRDCGTPREPNEVPRPARRDVETCYHGSCRKDV